MKLKKFLGGTFLMLAAFFVSSSSASLALVGTEDMPKSMKNKR